jgi:hypothetical protein
VASIHVSRRTQEIMPAALVYVDGVQTIEKLLKEVLSAVI